MVTLFLNYKIIIQYIQKCDGLHKNYQHILLKYWLPWETYLHAVVSVFVLASALFFFLQEEEQVLQDIITILVRNSFVT